MAVCFLGFAGITIWFVLYEIQVSQHAFCQLINTLNSPPKPSGNVTPKSNPARAYDLQLATDIMRLKEQLGC